MNEMNVVDLVFAFQKWLSQNGCFYVRTETKFQFSISYRRPISQVLQVSRDKARR